jgi:hypothetical protein
MKNIVWGGFYKKTKTENRPEKTEKTEWTGFFLKMRSKIETTVKKDTTRYSELTQDIKRKVFWRRYQISNKISLVFRV